MYAFYPNYEVQKRNTCFVESVKGFNQQEMTDIKNLCDNLKIESGVLVGLDQKPAIDDNYRKCQVGWMEHNQDTAWLYDKISFMVQKINKEYFNYDLFGFLEPFQYTIYNENTKDHYDWHLDRAGDGNWALSLRKLSISIQLSDESEYEGGELEIKDYNKGSIIKKGLGTMVFFPSFALHKVHPVTKGTRKSLVIWVAGPPFR